MPIDLTPSDRRLIRVLSRARGGSVPVPDLARRCRMDGDEVVDVLVRLQEPINPHEADKPGWVMIVGGILDGVARLSPWARVRLERDQRQQVATVAVDPERLDRLPDRRPTLRAPSINPDEPCERRYPDTEPHIAWSCGGAPLRETHRDGCACEPCQAREWSATQPGPIHCPVCHDNGPGAGWTCLCHRRDSEQVAPPSPYQKPPPGQQTTPEKGTVEIVRKSKGRPRKPKRKGA